MCNELHLTPELLPMPLLPCCALAWHPIADHYPHTTGTPASGVKPESAVLWRQFSCVPRARNSELSLVYRKYQAGGKIQESSELRKEKVHNSGAFFPP